MPAYAIPILAKITHRPIEYFLIPDHKVEESKVKTAMQLAEIINQRDEEIEALKAELNKGETK